MPADDSTAPATLTYKTTPPPLAVQAWRLARVTVFGYDLFLSHAHADGRLYALALWPRLEESGLTVCFDRSDFHIGERLHLKMRRTVAASRGLLLLDTPAARTSVEVAREIGEAVARDIPLYVVRREDLASTEWPLVDDDDPLLHAREPLEAFDAGRPGNERIEQIDQAYRGRRARRSFRRLAASVAALLIGLGSLSAINRLFDVRAAAIYAEIHDPAASIQRLDDDYAGLSGSLVLGFVGRRFRQHELGLLRDALSRVQLKQIDSALASILSAHRPPTGVRRSFPQGVPTRFALVPSQEVVFSVHDGQFTRYTESDALNCQGWAGEPVAVTLDPATSHLALATSSGLFVWDDLRCQDEPRQADVRRVRASVDGLLRFSFGNQGRSLLLAWPDGVSVFDCSGTAGCVEGVSRTVGDATPIQRAGGGDDGMAFCEALISPTSELVVTSVGQCDGASVRRDICAFTSPLKCERNTDRSRLSFDPTGRWLIGADPVFSRWDVSTTAPATTPRPPLDEHEWRFEQAFDWMTGTELAAFNRAGDRLLVTRGLGGAVLALYAWPDMTLLQTQEIPFQPESLAVDWRAALWNGQESSVFDIRR